MFETFMMVFCHFLVICGEESNKTFSGDAKKFKRSSKRLDDYKNFWGIKNLGGEGKKQIMLWGRAAKDQQNIFWGSGDGDWASGGKNPIFRHG